MMDGYATQSQYNLLQMTPDDMRLYYLPGQPHAHSPMPLQYTYLFESIAKPADAACRNLYLL